MNKSKDAWTAAHDLALIYIALAYGTDHNLSDEELSTITTCLQAWRADLDAADAQEIVLEALAVYLEGEAGAEVARSIDALVDALGAQERRRALEDVVRIAEADGVLLSSEQNLIATLADAWGIKATGERLIDRTSAEVEERPAWSLLHDVGLIYLVVAHSTDGELSDAEIAAIVERTREWQPELSEEDAREVLRSVLEFYAQQPGEEALGRSVGAVKKALPLIQRLVVLDDLHYIASADGTINENEHTMIDALAQAWGVSVHMSSRSRGEA